MIIREDVLEEVSRLHDIYLTDHLRKEGITDYIMRLLQKQHNLSTSKVYIDHGTWEEEC